MYRIIVIGAVKSTLVTLQKLIAHGFNIQGVLGYEPIKTDKISKVVSFKDVCKEHGIEYRPFQRINEESHLNWAFERKPDIIFAVGFSQLMSSKWLEIPKLGCVGFHPTQLPQGRGRAPISWLILEQKDGAANFFLMGQGADEGSIFIQEPFIVDQNDDVVSVQNKIMLSIGTALDKWLPDLKKGIWNPIEQDHSKASWYEKRAVEDGLIDWEKSADEINRLIKATTYPHPGAYTYHKQNKIIILNSQIESNLNIKGVVGRILRVDQRKGYLVQCGVGLIWLKNLIDESGEDVKLLVGVKLGLSIEDIFLLLKNN